MTTGGSVLMFGPSNKERRKCKAPILITEIRWMPPTLIPIVNTQQWSSWKKGSEDTDPLLFILYKLHEKITSDKRQKVGSNMTTAECQALTSTLHFPSTYHLKENQQTLKRDLNKHQDRWKICLTNKGRSEDRGSFSGNLQYGLKQGHRESDQKYMQKKQQ